jgi:hypothetical protein
VVLTRQQRGRRGRFPASTSGTDWPTCWRAGSISRRCAPRRRSSIWCAAGTADELREVLHLGEGTGTGRPPLIEIHNLEIHGGTLTLRLPWKPSPWVPSGRRDSALAAERALPGRVIVQGLEGLELVRRFDSLDLGLERLTISTPNRDPLSMVIDTLGVRVSDPGGGCSRRAAVRGSRGQPLVRDHARRLPSSTFQGAGVGDLPEGRSSSTSGCGSATRPGGPALDLSRLPRAAARSVVIGKSQDAERASYADGIHSRKRHHADRRPAGGAHRRPRGLGVGTWTCGSSGSTSRRPSLPRHPAALGSISGQVAGNGLLSDLRAHDGRPDDGHQRPAAPRAASRARAESSPATPTA